MKIRRFLTAFAVCAVLLCLCACQAQPYTVTLLPNRPDETMQVQLPQYAQQTENADAPFAGTAPSVNTGESTAPKEQKHSEASPAVPVPTATPAPEPPADASKYFYVERAEKEVQSLFWLVYQSICSHEDRIKLPEGVTRAQIDAVKDLLYIDCPELFWYSHLSAYHYLESDPNTILEVDVSYLMTEDEAKSCAAKIESLAEKWIAATSGKSDYEKELYVHDAIIDGCTYSADAEHSGTIYGALILGKARCQGYANAMTYIMRRMGIECAYIYGEGINENGTESHAWNILKIDSMWTLADLTWDDLQGQETRLYAYFNVNDALMNTNHVRDAAFEKANLPSCDSLQRSYCVKNDCFVYEDQDAEGALAEILTKMLRKKESSGMIQFAVRAQYDAAMSSLQRILQKAADEEKVYPSNFTYLTDPWANYIFFCDISYDE